MTNPWVCNLSVNVNFHSNNYLAFSLFLKAPASS